MNSSAESSFDTLNRFAVNLTIKASKGLLDPVIGRDEEIRRVIQVLSRRTKNISTYYSKKLLIIPKLFILL